MPDDTNPKDEDKTTQETEDGEEIEIKDPIYDIMGDKELAAATEKLMAMIDESNEADEENEEK